jgi:O-antigen/teichoic acid export membrane protein
MIAVRVVDRLIGLASTLILARVLTPADFGLVAMAMAVIGLIELASAFGFEVPLLRAAQPTRAQYDTVWTLNLLFGLGCAAVTAAVAVPAAGFYQDGRLVPVMLVLAAGWAVSSLTNVGIVDYRRNLDFAKEFRLQITMRLVTVAVTIPAALFFHSYWALIAGTSAGRVAGVALSYLWHPYRPRLCLQAARELFSFSTWIFVEKIASFGNARAPDFVLGRTHGPAAVGQYRLAEEIAYLPGSEFVAPINRVFLPGMARLVEQGRNLADVVTTTTGVVALLLLPACVGIAAVAEPLVRAMLGSQWLGTIPLIEIMAAHTALVALWSNQQMALLAAGLPKQAGIIAVARLIVFAPCVLLLAPAEGPIGVAVSVLVASVFTFFFGLHLSLRRLSMKLAGYIGAVWRPAVASIFMLAMVRLLLNTLGPSASALDAATDLAAAVGAGVLAYAVALALLFLASGRPEGAEQLVLRRASQWLRRPRGTASVD